LLEVSSLSAGYGDAQVLWDVSLTVAEGEIVTVVGPNGAGKTSLVNSLIGLVERFEGDIRLNNVSLNGLPPFESASQGIAIVPEGRRLFPEMSVQDNLDIGSYTSRARPYHDELQNQVFELFPILSRRKNQLAGTLSGGEQQMVALGRALMARPRLLLLDEPSLGLAPLVTQAIFDTLVEINQSGVSILIVEQNVVKAFELASRGYVLEVGRIVRSGSSAELLEDEYVRESYLGL